MLRRLTYLLFSASLFLAMSGTARADVIPVPGENNPVQQVAFTSSTGTVLDTIWGHVLSIAFGVLGGLALIMVFYGGIQYISSGGSPEGAKRGRQTLINGVSGVVVLTAAYAIINVLYAIAHFVAQKL